MSVLIDFIIPIMLSIGISFIASYSMKDRSFSLDIFLICISVCIMILVWIPALPELAILIPIIILAAMLLRTRTGSSVGV